MVDSASFRKSSEHLLTKSENLNSKEKFLSPIRGFSKQNVKSCVDIEASALTYESSYDAVELGIVRLRKSLFKSSFLKKIAKCKNSDYSILSESEFSESQ